MAILIANLGTSDLTVQLGDFFFPILHRDFINVDLSGLSQEEREAWEKEQRDFFVTGLASELGISEENYAFREISRKLLNSYRENPSLWHHRIHLGRIWGAIQKALEFQVKQVYLFVTNQPESATKGYPTDTIHVFEILQLWLTQQGLNLELIKQEIPQHISPVQEDKLFEYYYDFFVKLISEINSDPVILVSIKGGTAQMQQALRNQALASGMSKILFIDLKDEPQRILHGQPSQSSLRAFWKYIKIQKIKTIIQLLERWDFDGANQIVNEWRNTLEFLQKNGIEEVSDLLETLQRVNSAMEMGVAFLNLDNGKANNLTGQVPALNRIASSYDVSLNIYTQCRIFQELNQYANLLLRLSTFVESCQSKIISKLGYSYFSCLDDLELDVSKINEGLWQNFCQLEGRNNRQFVESDFRGRYKLRNRFSTRNFIQAIVDTHSLESEITCWNQIQEVFDSLEFWIEIRNNLAHAGQGVSLETMNVKLNSEKKRGNDKAIKACSPGEIINRMTQLYNLKNELLRQQKSNFTSRNSKFYIYSEIREWVLNELRDV